MSTEAQYKELLLTEFAKEIKALSPEYTEQENCDWLWGTVEHLGVNTPENICALAQLALHFGRSSLDNPEILRVLADDQTGEQERIQQVIDIIQS